MIQYGKLCTILNSVLRFAVLAVFLSLSALAQSANIVLRGTIVTPSEVINDGYVSISGEKITAVGSADTIPVGAAVVETKSIIFPGLIDLHDHIVWNVFPRWQHNVEFSTRYEWQQRPSYAIALSTPRSRLYADGLACYMNRYGEVKAIVGGATSVAGTVPTIADPMIL